MQLIHALHQICSIGARHTTPRFNLTKWLSYALTLKHLKSSQNCSGVLIRVGHHQALHTSSHNTACTTGTVVDVVCRTTGLHESSRDVPPGQQRCRHMPFTAGDFEGLDRTTSLWYSGFTLSSQSLLIWQVQRSSTHIRGLNLVCQDVSRIDRHKGPGHGDKSHPEAHEMLLAWSNRVCVHHWTALQRFGLDHKDKNALFNFGLVSDAILRCCTLACLDELHHKRI